MVDLSKYKKKIVSSASEAGHKAAEATKKGAVYAGARLKERAKEKYESHKERTHERAELRNEEKKVERQAYLEAYKERRLAQLQKRGQQRGMQAASSGGRFSNTRRNLGTARTYVRRANTSMTDLHMGQSYNFNPLSEFKGMGKAKKQGGFGQGFDILGVDPFTRGLSSRKKPKKQNLFY